MIKLLSKNILFTPEKAAFIEAACSDQYKVVIWERDASIKAAERQHFMEIWNNSSYPLRDLTINDSDFKKAQWRAEGEMSLNQDHIPAEEAVFDQPAIDVLDEMAQTLLEITGQCPLSIMSTPFFKDTNVGNDEPHDHNFHVLSQKIFLPGGRFPTKDQGIIQADEGDWFYIAPNVPHMADLSSSTADKSLLLSTVTYER